MSDPHSIRPILAEDWESIAKLESLAYAEKGLSEERSFLESRGSASPETCFLLDSGQRTSGYLLSMPYPLFRYPDLSRGEQTIFSSPNLHVHDIVVAEDLRGNGLASMLLGHLTTVAQARNHDRISLVAVGGSTALWAAQGLQACPAVTVSAEYGADAVYMSTTI